MFAAVEEDFPPHPRDVPEFFFPVAQADITECSTYAVVCRLKPSPAYAITSSGGSFSHPDYPRVTVTIPENAVTPEAKIPLVLKVGRYALSRDLFLLWLHDQLMFLRITLTMSPNSTEM